MKLDADAARRGIEEKIAGPLRMSVTAAAQAIVEIAIAKMSLAVREVSVAKDDPRDLRWSPRRAGPLHVTAIARELNIPKVVVPLFPSHFSALGMLWRTSGTISSAPSTPTSPAWTSALLRIHHEMVKPRACVMPRMRSASSISTCAMSGRSSLQVPVSVAQIEQIVPASAPRSTRYEHRYAHHSPDEPVEMVNIRLAMIGKRPKLAFPRLADTGAASQHAGVTSISPTGSVAARSTDEALGAGSAIAGPALIQEHGTTTVLFERDA